MKTMYKNALKVTAAAVSLAVLITVNGIGCGVGFQPIGGNEFSSIGAASDAGDNGGLNVVAGTRTVAVSNYTAVLENMVSLTGVPPSNATTQIFQAKLGSFSEKGNATSVNAPMLFGYIAVGAETCNDLINQEANATPRRFLASLNLGQNGVAAATAAYDDATLGDLVRRFARQFWQRNETPEEFAMIKAGVAEMIAAPGANANGLTRRTALYVCTAMISSTSTYEL